MAEYVHLEDSLLDGFEKLSFENQYENKEDHLKSCVEQFNALSANFQDTWTEEYFVIYNHIRGYGPAEDDDRVKSLKSMENQVFELQNLAIAMSRSSRVPNLGTDRGILARIDEESKVFTQPTYHKPERTYCGNCVAF